MKKPIITSLIITLVLSLFLIGCKDTVFKDDDPSSDDNISKTENASNIIEENLDNNDGDNIESSGEPEVESDPEEDLVQHFDTDDNFLYRLNGDLNNDGIEDTVQIFCPFDSDGIYHDYTLKVNNTLGTFVGDTIEPQFNILDINEKDDYKEIAISEYGPSSDDATSFYRYDGEDIIPVGYIQGFYGKYPEWDGIGAVIIDGSGIIKTKSRGDILQTWFFDDEYKLDDDFTLKQIPKELYIMDTEVTVLKELTLKESRNDDKDSITLKPGDLVTIKETDNESWCSVVNKDGETGWFKVYDFYMIESLDLMAPEVFEGLSYAD